MRTVNCGMRNELFCCRHAHSSWPTRNFASSRRPKVSIVKRLNSHATCSRLTETLQSREVSYKFSFANSHATVVLV